VEGERKTRRRERESDGKRGRDATVFRVSLAYLDVQEVVVGAGGQQEAPRRVGELTVVDLLLVLLLKHPEQHGALHVPHLKRGERGGGERERERRGRDERERRKMREERERRGRGERERREKGER